MARTYAYRMRLDWTGDRDAGWPAWGPTAVRTPSMRQASRPSPDLSGPAFRGDMACWNPEELLLAPLLACHQLWYLGLCAEAGFIVAYGDEPETTMVEEADSGGRFTAVVLRPRVTVEDGSDVETAEALHRTAHAKCFIAQSVNFVVSCEPVIRVAAPGSVQG